MSRYGIIVRAELVPYSDPNIMVTTLDSFKNYNDAGKKLEKLNVPNVSDIQFVQLSYFSVGKSLYGKGFGYITADFILLGTTDLSPHDFMDVMSAAISSEVNNATADERSSGCHISSFKGVRLYHFNKDEYMEFYDDNVPVSTPGYKAQAQKSAQRSSFDSNDNDDAGSVLSF